MMRSIVSRDFEKIIFIPFFFYKIVNPELLDNFSDQCHVAFLHVHIVDVEISLNIKECELDHFS